MMERIITGLMLVVAVIHLVPIRSLFGAAQLEALYGVDVSDPNLAILMRHRAVLFGILGTFFVYAAFVPAAQPIAFAAASASIASFFVLAAVARGFSDSIRKIVVGDVVAAIALVAAIGLYIAKS